MNAVRRILVILAALLAPVAATASDTLLTLHAHGMDHHYDLSALQAFDHVEFTTSTIWTEGPQTFRGVPLAALIKDAGVTEGTIIATAINDYSAEIPFEEIGPDAPILAYHRNGATMPIRDKGPLWLVYPYDQESAFRSEIIYSRSVWQLDRLAVDP
ncbi:molybdopterin-dependent oxidoreductase [Alphaproteobacteria bacterium GH1-50]|uniref:Molybdopterin-dependent oxidoreductase n=1 Tax=Kangsaoukella pontilimi TaxID=2691042 RepID=A0A7C9IRF9_9RHOB|nr:molybdopterin-dependent oxidoreductase [Kangsaoukella pontilimi]MXQ07486.1 molybdopterin-dependent oxidoreductase [Kangsaoukella pontilimi]